MGSDKSQIASGAAFPGAFAGFWSWHSPQSRKLTPAEIDRYLARTVELSWPLDGGGRYDDNKRRPEGQPCCCLAWS